MCGGGGGGGDGGEGGFGAEGGFGQGIGGVGGVGGASPAGSGDGGFFGGGGVDAFAGPESEALGSFGSFGGPLSSSQAIAQSLAQMSGQVPFSDRSFDSSAVPSAFQGAMLAGPVGTGLVGLALGLSEPGDDPGSGPLGLGIGEGGGVGSGGPGAAGLDNRQTPQGRDATQIGQGAVGQPQFTRPSTLPVPPSFLGLSGQMTPFQQRASLATFGLNADDARFRDPSAIEFFKNLVRHELIDESGKPIADAQILPVERQFLEQVLGGVPASESVGDFLRALG